MFVCIWHWFLAGSRVLVLCEVSRVSEFESRIETTRFWFLSVSVVGMSAREGRFFDCLVHVFFESFGGSLTTAWPDW